MTAASGLARSFLELALARVGVGIGEAAGSPPAHSLISDYFPPERRATALSIYATGIYVGVMIAYLAGGYVLQHFSWRAAFFLVGGRTGTMQNGFGLRADGSLRIGDDVCP